MPGNSPDHNSSSDAIDPVRRRAGDGRSGLADAQPDAIDQVIEQWGRERPDLDVSPVAVVGRISRISRSFERAIETVFRDYALTSASFYVLAALRRSGPPFRMSPTQLHRSLLVAGGTMTHRLSRLEAAGLVIRKGDPNDGRRVQVMLTDQGRILVDQVIKTHNQHEHALLGPLTPDERDDLASLLRKLT